MPPFSWHAADASMVRRILAESDVLTKPERPSLMAYAGAWFEAMFRWIARFFEQKAGLVDGLLKGLAIFALGTVVLTLILVGVAVVRRLRDRAPRGYAAPRFGRPDVLDEAPPARDRAGWRAQIEERLSRGDVAGALEALWWWLASSLTLESAVDASWTTRELLVRARRRELLGLGGILDVLMYGPHPTTAHDVKACLARFEEKLA
jgi:hypothetical protein